MSSENESSDDEDDGDDVDNSEDSASSTPKAKKEKKKKTKPKPPKLRKYPKQSRSLDVPEEALASRIAEATEHMTCMELFKQASAYSKHYLIRLFENLCVSGMRSKRYQRFFERLRTEVRVEASQSKSCFHCTNRK